MINLELTYVIHRPNNPYESSPYSFHQLAQRQPRIGRKIRVTTPSNNKL